MGKGIFELGLSFTALLFEERVFKKFHFRWSGYLRNLPVTCMYCFILQYLDSYKETMLSLLKTSTQFESQALQNDKKFGQVLFL